MFPTFTNPHWSQTIMVNPHGPHRVREALIQQWIEKGPYMYIRDTFNRGPLAVLSGGNNRSLSKKQRILRSPVRLLSGQPEIR